MEQLPLHSNQLKRRDDIRSSRVIPNRRKEFIINGNKIIYASLDALIGFICEPCSDIKTRESFIYTFRCYADQNKVLKRFSELYQKNEDQRTVIIYNIVQFMSKVMVTSDNETIDLIQNIIQLHMSVDEVAANNLQMLLNRTQTKITLPPTSSDVTLAQMIFSDDFTQEKPNSRQFMTMGPKYFEEVTPISKPIPNTTTETTPKKNQIVIGRKTPGLNDQSSGSESSSLESEAPIKNKEKMGTSPPNHGKWLKPNLDRTQKARTIKLGKKYHSKVLNFDFINIPAMVFAKQVTLIEYELFMKIPISELYSWNTSNRENTAPHIIEFLQHHTKMEHWYVQLILLSPQSQRLEVLRRIIEIGIRMSDLNNWSGLVEIATALDAFPIYRLEQLFLQLNENDKENMRQIKSLGSIDSLLMNDSNMIPGACVPFVSTYLRKVIEINKNAQPSIQSGDFVLINVEKCRQLSHYIVDWVQCQKFPYLFGSNIMMQEWIENNLRKVVCNEDSEYQWSLQIEKEKRKTMVINNEINVLKHSNGNKFIHPQHIPCNDNMTISDFLKITNADGIFMLSPTSKLLKGQVINISETVKKVLESTKNYRNEDTVFALVKNLIQVKVFCFEHYHHKDKIHFNVMCLDSSQTIIQNIVFIKQVCEIDDVLDDEFFEEKYAIMYRDNSQHRFNFVSPFATNILKTDGELVLLPTRFMEPLLTQMEIGSKSQIVFMNEFDCFNSTFNVQLKSYKMIIREGFLLFYSSKRTIVVPLGYYKLKLLHDPIKDRSMIILVESTDLKENPIVVIIPDCRDILNGTIKLANQIATFCTPSHKTHCTGVDVDKLEANPIPKPYDSLLNSIFTSDNLVLNRDFFDLSVQPKRWMEALYYLEEGIIPIEPVVNSQLLLILLKLHPTTFIPITFHSQIKEKYKLYHAALLSGDEKRIEETKKEKETYIKRVFTSMSYNKQVIVIGICKVLDYWAEGKINRLGGIKNIIDDALIKGEIEGIDIVHDIAQLNVTINKSEGQICEFEWQASIFNNVQRKVFDDFLGMMQRSMAISNVSFLELDKNDKFEVMSPNILMMKDDKLWKDSVSNIILKGGSDNQPIDEISKEMTIELNVVEDYDSFKTFSLNLECRNRTKFTSADKTKERITQKFSFLRETRMSFVEREKGTYLKMLLNKRNRPTRYPE